MPENPKPNGIEEKLRRLHGTYAQRLPDKIILLDEDWRRWKRVPNGGGVQDLIRQAHTLAGSGATFGFAGVSELARMLELELGRLESPPSERQVQLIDRLVRELHAAAKDNPPFPPFKAAPPLQSVGSEPTGPSSHAMVWVVDADLSAAAKLAEMLTPFGYRARPVRFDLLHEELNRETPIALLMDTGTGPDDLSGCELVLALREAGVPLPPIVFVTRRGDIHARLAAVRAGGVAYLTQPLNLTELLSILRPLASSRDFVPPYRILIVDDDEPTAYHSALMLGRAGMDTRVVSDPLTLLEVLHDFQPELILLDIYMPRCTGLELAKLIRQHTPYVGTAIVFFSVEIGIDRHLNAMRLGGDDFLVKPIEPERLVASVEARARRTRSLMSLMRQDGLTGLLNHVSFMEQLDRELARAQRYGLSLTYVIIDLDRFKTINDRQGHAAGDAVLRSLAQVLRQRLRGVDVIGRYGGEEFALLLPDTRLDVAFAVIDEIRATFAALPQSGFRQTFNATFSAGMAEYPVCPSRELLLETADGALYRAKEQGRNQVVRAGCAL